MAIPIKAIPTLYGEEAARLRRKIDEVEERFASRPKRDTTDMGDLFRDDAISYRKYQMGNTYCFLSTENSKDIVACFTVSNDSLRIYDLPNSRRNAM